MIIKEVSDRLIHQWKSKKPFVAYRFPNEQKLFVHLQKNDDWVCPDDNFKGFVMFPFFTKSTPLGIRGDEKLESPLNSKETRSFSKQLIKTKSFSNQREVYIEKIQKALQELRLNTLKKVVLSTRFDLKCSNLNPISYFEKLLIQYPKTFNYIIYHPEEGTWLGATPEALIELENDQLTTFALAGTKPTNFERWGIKELEEQKYVSDQIYATLSEDPTCSDISISDIETIQAGNIDHILTKISANIQQPNVWKLARSLHPTPAVGGVPKNDSLEFIKKHENYNRSFYTGFLGIHESLRTRFFVNLRCMRLSNNKASIYVGGGITSKSDPASEWNEIIHKAQTMLQVLAS